MNSYTRASRHCILKCLGFALLALLVLMPTAALAADRNQRLVNENQHRTEQAPVSWSCTNNPPSEESVSVPLSSLGADPLLSAHAYHVGEHRQEAQARCYYNAYVRPKIISSDIGGVLPVTAKTWMQRVQNNHALGQIHFEHYERCLVELSPSPKTVPIVS